MQNAELFSPAFPNGDRGGVAILVTPPDGKPISLRAYWEGLEGAFAGETRSRRLAKRLGAAYPEKSFGADWKDPDVVRWAKQSRDLARRVAYADGHLAGAVRSNHHAGSPPTISPLYAESAHATADRQIALAGYRMAAVLQRLADQLPEQATASAPEPAESPQRATVPATQPDAASAEPSTKPSTGPSLPPAAKPSTRNAFDFDEPE